MICVVTNGFKKNGDRKLYCIKMWCSLAKEKMYDKKKKHCRNFCLFRFFA